jgi:hypothetical protein
MKLRQLFTIILALTVTACTVTVDQDNPPPRPGPRPGICPRIYQPVCATRFAERQTFPNACVAETRGFDIIYGGECRRRPLISEPDFEPTPRPRPFPDDINTVCPSFVAPVCARRGGIIRTFQNACIAQGSGFSVVDDGPC